MPTSERLYYSDSFLKSFSASVREAREVAGAAAEPLWQLALDRSAFYPTSGGQPFDTGTLTAKSQSGSPFEIAVELVEEDESGKVWHYTRNAVAAGAQVEGRIDWERRFDHMQQHTGQHLISAVFAHELKAPTVSFHLGDQTSTIDLSCGPLAHHSLERVERLANELIAEDRPVTISYASREEADAMLAAGELRKLPDREGSIRIIDIAGYDRNACGGTHVRSTGQIGGLLIRRIEKVTRGVRVEFVCGLRAVRTARVDYGVLSEASALLSSSAADLPSSINRLLADGKTAGRERQKLREELAVYQAAELARDAQAENGLRLIVRTWKDRGRDYVRLLSSRTAAAAQSTVVIFSARDASPVRVFIARSRDLGINCGQIMKDALAQFGLRGGGSPDLAQGDIPEQEEERLRAGLTDAIRSALATVSMHPE